MTNLTALFLDTTIHVERVFGKSHWEPYVRLAGKTATCGFSRLEFKRVIIQNYSLALRYLIEEQSYFGAILRTQKLPRDRQARMLSTVLAFTGQNVDNLTADQTSTIDVELRLRSISYLRNAILGLWEWFECNVDEIVNRMECQRSLEAPKERSGGDIDVTIHAKKCNDGGCNNDNFLRTQLPQIKKIIIRLDAIEATGAKLTDELISIRKALREALKTNSYAGFQDYQKCLSLGDLWIHLECFAAEFDVIASTNYKESEILAPILGLTHIRSPEK